MKRSDSIFRCNWVLVAALVLLLPGQWCVQTSGWLDDYIVRVIMLIGIRITAAVSLQLISGISGQFSLGHAGFMAIGAYIAAYPAVTFSHDLTRPFSVVAFYLAVGCVIVVSGAAIYGLYRAAMLSRSLFAAGPAVLALLVAFWVLCDLATAPAQATPTHVWAWAFSHLSGLYGSTLGALMPLGDRMSATLPAGAAVPICYIVQLSAGGLFAAGAGLLVGVPALRLRGDYLAIATLGFAEIVRVMLQTSPALGGALGMTGIPKFGGFAWVYGVAILTIFAVWRLVHSARGRAMLAVREDEIAAASVGIDPARSKVLAFVVGAFFAGAAGATLVHYEGYVTPDNFNFMQSVELVVIVTLAGSGSITGTVVVAAILTWLPEQLRQFHDYRMILYSLLLIVLMVVRPNGLLGNRELVFWCRKRADAAA